MPVMYNTGDWFILRPDTYRKLDLNVPEWPLDVDLEYMLVACAPFGGPVAMTRDPMQIVPMKGSVKISIRIFNTAGEELAIIWWKHGKLMTMGWSDTEELICVQDDAMVYVYDIFGQEKESYSMGQEASLTKIIDAKVFQSLMGTGVAVMTTNGRIFLKHHNSKDFRPRALPEMPKSSVECSCWEIVIENRNTYCLVGREQEVIKLMPGELVGSIVRNLFEKPFDRILLMSVSQSHQNLAMYTNTGILWMGNVSMTQKYCEFDTGRKDIPRQIEWIMNMTADKCNVESDAVVISYKFFLLIVNRNGDKNLFTYDPAIILIPEMDGVRILTNNTHEMIQKLPKCIQNIFAINSQEPSSFLFEAEKKYQEKSHQAAEYLSLFRDRMEMAVNECIEAAGHEFSPDTQKSLMRAAYFGKGFIASHDPSDYVKMLRILRVLNALRHPKIAISLTITQLKHFQPEVILTRLVLRKHYAIAIQMAKYLKLSESWILEHWAYHKILHDQNDNEVARKITEKFKNPSVEGISFCNIALKAHENGRDELSIKLLELEPKASLQVPLLLELGKYERAIHSSIQSGDTELMATTLQEIKKVTLLTNFHLMIREYPMALNTYKNITKEWSNAALYAVYDECDDHKAIAEYDFRIALENQNLDANLPLITSKYVNAKCSTEADLCSETSRLRKLQKSLQEKYHVSLQNRILQGLSVHDTVATLLDLGELKEADKLRHDFKIPDRRYWWLRIQHLSRSHKWEELEKFSKSKRSPIGYEPFVEVSLNRNRIPEARKYIHRVPDARKAHWYLRAELLDEAVEAAYNQRDSSTLFLIERKAKMLGDRVILERIETCNNLMSSTRK